MNVTERGLLHAIATEPDNDTHRLVYADWIDDHGDPDRAEFIRAQIHLANHTADSRVIAGHRQVFVAMLTDEMTAGVFDFDGNLIDYHRRRYAMNELHEREIEHEEWVKQLEIQSARLSVKRFRFNGQEGIIDYPRFIQDEFDRNGPEMQDMVITLQRWIASGQFVWEYLGDDYWLDRSGEVVAT